MKSQNTYYTE